MNNTGATEILEILNISVDYNAETGLLSWKEKPLCLKDAMRWNSRRVGAAIGYLNEKGYPCISFRVNGKPKRFFAAQGCLADILRLMACRGD